MDRYKERQKQNPSNGYGSSEIIVKEKQKAGNLEVKFLEKKFEFRS
jgi:hypothetical protein